MIKEQYQSTPRRSLRQQNQPLLISSLNKSDLSTSHLNTWCGPPTRVRPATRQDFPGDEDFCEEDGREIQFHDSFIRRNHAKRISQTYSKKRKRIGVVKNGSELGEVFKIGDTVLVASNTKEPSIAVVMSMWEEFYGNGDVEDRSEHMKIQIHWFLRPAQLARIRQQRDHYKVSGFRLHRMFQV
jgi:origin recognition complex subunit 1